MQMLYNSDSFAVVRFDVPAGPAAPAQAEAQDVLTRGGYEIFDKLARKEIFLDGLVAESFRQGVDALIEKQPTQDEIDDYIGRYTQLAQQPVVMH
jgi:Protein of unknown function (DUF3567)